MLKRIPEDLPLFGALAGALGLLAFGFTGMFVELYAGRPSSTSSLGIIFIPIWAAVFGFAGLLLGALARTIWKRVKPIPNEIVMKRTSLWIALGVLIIASSLFGAAEVFVYEAESKPSIIVDLGVISATISSNSDKVIRSSSKLYESQSPQKSISWGQNESHLILAGLDVKLNDHRRSLSAHVKAAGLDYITYIHAASFAGSGKREPFLVVIIAGRATGRRALIVVLDADYRIIYQRRIERDYSLSDTPLEIRLAATSQDEIVVVAPTCETSLVLRVR